MKINKLLQLLVVCCFVVSCTKDTFEEQKVDDTNSRIAQDQFDNSHLGVYKGLFTTVDGLTRGSVVVTLLPSNEGLAQITLSTGELIELKSSTVKLTVDNTVNNLRFSSVGISEIDATLEFSVEGDGFNPVITNVTFDNKASDIFIAKNLSRAPLSPITGTYVRTAGSGGFPTSGRTWNVMSIGAGNAQTFATQIAYGGRVYNTPANNNVQSGCANSSGYTTCDINGSARILGHDLTWSGRHKYNPGNAANDNQCAEVSGSWSAPTYGGSSGTFISDTSCSGPAVANDLCTSAFTATVGGVYNGSNVNASTTGAPTTNCNSVSLNQSGGVWYKFVSPSSISLIVNTAGSDFDTKLGVLSGVCGALTCVSANDDFTGLGLRSQVSFTATANVTYYFYVTGYVGGTQTGVGNYVLNVIDNTPPANNLCAGATTIGTDQTLTGSTLTATTTGAPATCTTTMNTAPGVWFRYSTPTAKTLVVDTQGSTFDTKLGVYSGSCAALTCVIGNDDGPAGFTPQSRLTFAAAAGTTYYFYVTGASTASGNYNIRTTEIFPPANDQCSGAVVLALGGTASGSTLQATSIGAPTTTCNGFSLNTSAGIWYRFSTPTSKVVKVNTVGSNFDTRLGIYSGTSCAALTCVTANDNGPTGVTPQSEITFTAVAGTQYYFYVTGSGTTSGNVTINTIEILPPANDLCANATAVTCGGTVTGTTTAASTTGVPTATCNSFSLNTSGGVWHTFVSPTTQQVTAKTLGSNFDTKLGVFSGTCGALVCVTANDDGPIDTTSQVVFNATAGTTYYFYVTGFSTNTGNYTLNVTCGEVFTSSTNLTCTQTLVDNGGTAGNYTANRNDIYYIDAGVGFKASLLFTVFNTEATYDGVRIYDGQTVNVANEITSVNGRVVYTNATTPTRNGFSGTGTGANSLQGQTVVSTGRYLTIVFKSDGSIQAAGFQATVNCVSGRMADVSHQRTSETFMPAASPSVPKIINGNIIVSEQDNPQEYQRRKLEAYNKKLRESSNKDYFNSEGRKETIGNTDGFLNDEERMIYAKKNKQ